MFRLSGLGDEIGHELALQIDTLKRLDIRRLELRGVWGKNVLDLTDGEVERARAALAAAGIGVSAIASPTGKMEVTEPLAPHLERFRRACALAHTFDCRYIRVFSYYIPAGRSADEFRDEVIDRMGAKVHIAEQEGLTLLHENEARIYGEQPERCLDLLETIGSPHFKAIFDAANFIVAGRRPYEECWPLLKAHVAYFHIRDATLSERRVALAGKGDGRIADTLKDAEAAGFDGFLSLEPHLKAAGAFEGYSRPQLFEAAATALRGILAEIGAVEE